jgi:hypothetical protein
LRWRNTPVLSAVELKHLVAMLTDTTEAAGLCAAVVGKVDAFWSRFKRM